MAEKSVAEVLTFPTDSAQFENDDRISFSRLDNKYIAVQESDGTEFEFDAQLKRWIPLADEDEEALIQQQQSAYVSAVPAQGAQSGIGNKRKQGDLEVSCECWSAWSCRIILTPTCIPPLPYEATVGLLVKALTSKRKPRRKMDLVADQGAEQDLVRH